MKEDIHNFYFMINPYFPTKEMIRQVKKNLPHLIRYYPSSQEMIAEKIKQLEPVDMPLIAVNGSSEAIRVLLLHFQGRVLVTVPNFNEWEIADHHPIAYNASTSEIMASIRENRIDLVCISNPNNPTGYFREDIALLAESFPHVRFVIDISFIDFAGETIPAYPKGKNIILVKSLGKNYGVCGLRLGFIASEDEAYLGGLRHFLPIWNINSIAEFFLDLIFENRTAYEASRKKIIRGTARMAKILEEFDFIQVFPTRANFVMIRTVNELKFNVKNCAGKTGLDRQYYRVAYNRHYKALRHLIPL